MCLASARGASRNQYVTTIKFIADTVENLLTPNDNGLCAGTSKLERDLAANAPTATCDDSYFV
jgi:hypothetical protein